MPGESFTDLAVRLTCMWRLKLALLIGLTAGFLAPYLYLAHHLFFPVHQVPATWLDRAAGFNPNWVWVYQSLYLLTGTLPWLARTPEELWRYVKGFVLMSGIAFAIFLFIPTHVLRPAMQNSTGMYRWLLGYDGPYNAVPSLHAAILYYTLAFAFRMCGRLAPLITGGVIAWAVLILWATLATKQHYVVDLLAGTGLAVACDMLAWSRIERSAGTTSHAGFM